MCAYTDIHSNCLHGQFVTSDRRCLGGLCSLRVYSTDGHSIISHITFFETGGLKRKSRELHSKFCQVTIAIFPLLPSLSFICYFLWVCYFHFHWFILELDFLASGLPLLTPALNAGVLLYDCAWLSMDCDKTEGYVQGSGHCLSGGLMEGFVQIITNFQAVRINACGLWAT